MKIIIPLVILMQLLLLPCYGQHYTYQSTSPFGIQIVRDTLYRTGVAQKIMFFDYDGDHDLDLFLVGVEPILDLENIQWKDIPYFFEVQENTGDKWHPHFGPRVSAYQAFPFPLGYFIPSAGDINLDGQMDFIVNGIVDVVGKRTMIYCKKNAIGTMPEFEVTRFDSMDLNGFFPSSFFIPELVDLDLDGDLDILVSGTEPLFGAIPVVNDPTIYYAKNVGTAYAPEFKGWFKNPYGLIPNPLIEFTTCGDVDNDGDMDLLGFVLGIPPDSINYLYFHLNTPEANGKPSFDTVLQSPFGLPAGHGKEQFSLPTLVDIDGDGDLDLFVFRDDGHGKSLQYFENNLCAGVVKEMSVTICQGDSIVLYGNTYKEEGYYPISLQSTGGCDSTLLLTIVLIPAYNVSLNESICEGEVFVIGNESFSITGNYTVYLVAENGCDSLVSLSLLVHATVDNSVSIQQNNLTANLSGASYQWINCDLNENIAGATDQSYIATSSGNYAVSITDASGCTAVSECMSIVISGIAGGALSNRIMIYPNPSAGLIYVLNNTPYPVSSMTVTNLSGKVMGEFIPDGKNSVDIAFLGKGFYVVKIKINGREIIKKLIVI